MDQRDDETHEVVPLRRKDGSDPAERAELASQIFAQEGDIGTFSRGNLIPPTDQAPRPDSPEALLERLGLRIKPKSSVPGTAHPGEPEPVSDTIASDAPTDLAADAGIPTSPSGPD